MLIPVPVPQPEPKRPSAKTLDRDNNSVKRKFLGAAVLLALSAIVLPLLLDGSGSESRFRRVETLRQEPPVIISADGLRELSDPARPVGGLVKTLQRSDLPRLVNRSEATDKPSPAQADEDQKASVVVDPVSKDALDRTAMERQIAVASGQVALPQSTQPADITPVEQVTQASINQPAAALPDTPTDKDLNLAGAGPWVIQAASFVDGSKAHALRDRLRERGYPAFVATATVEVSSTLSNRYRVRVGPLADRIMLAKRKREIERLTGVGSMVTPYTRPQQ